MATNEAPPADIFDQPITGIEIGDTVYPLTAGPTMTDIAAMSDAPELWQLLAASVAGAVVFILFGLLLASQNGTIKQLPLWGVVGDAALRLAVAVAAVAFLNQVQGAITTLSGAGAIGLAVPQAVSALTGVALSPRDVPDSGETDADGNLVAA